MARLGRKTNFIFAACPFDILVIQEITQRIHPPKMVIIWDQNLPREKLNQDYSGQKKRTKPLRCGAAESSGLKLHEGEVVVVVRPEGHDATGGHGAARQVEGIPLARRETRGGSGRQLNTQEGSPGRGGGDLG